MPSHRLDERLLRLSSHDNIVVARTAIGKGAVLCLEEHVVTVAAPIPLGYKVAVRAIAAGEKIIKYGASIGSANCAIAPGDMVHTHNMQSDYLPTYGREGEEGFIHAH
jgi:altronate dehydratase small subunit